MAWVLTCATRLLDTSTTVTGTASPSSVNRRIMPTLRPNNPRELLRLIVFSVPDFNWPGLMHVGHGPWCGLKHHRRAARPSRQATARQHTRAAKTEILERGQGNCKPRAHWGRTGPADPGLLQLDLDVHA